MRHFLSLILLAASASPVLAAQAAAPPATRVGTPAPAAPAAAPTQGLGGPVVAGVCLLSREAIFANAKVGVAATLRLRELTTQAQAEVDALRAPIDADVRILQTDAPRLTADQLQTREQALNARLQPVQVLATQRSAEIEATRTKALARISTEAQPVITQAYAQKGCGLLLDRNSALGGNFTNDLTPAVVQALDARISTITFDRETLPAAPATSTTVQ